MQVIAEEFVDFARELSALVVRSPSGQAAAYPVTESVQRNGICVETITPAPDLTEAQAVEIERLALTIADELGVVGVLAVELMQRTDGSVVVNELAMRPHNTGHWSIDGAHTSQFENHLRAVLDLPLGDPGLREDWTVMSNVLGGSVDRPAVGAAALLRPGPPAAGAALRQAGPARPQGRPRDRVRRRPRAGPQPRPARRRLPDGRARCLSRPAARVGHRDGLGLRLAGDAAAATALAEFDVPYEADVVSAHRMPDAMIDYGRTAADRGLAVIIAGAGGAAHLPGMLAAVTPLPVIGVPVPLKYLDGMDSLLSIVQMPAGVPVATVAIGNARNAGLLAVRILAAADPDLRRRMVEFQDQLRQTAEAKGEAVRDAARSDPASRTG